MENWSKDVWKPSYYSNHFKTILTQTYEKAELKLYVQKSSSAIYESLNIDRDYLRIFLNMLINIYFLCSLP